MTKVARLEDHFFRWHFVADPFAIEPWLEDQRWVYDFDSCGPQITFWVVMRDGEPTFHKCRHDWYWRDYGHEDNHAVNEFEHTVVGRDDLDEWARKALRFVV